MIKKMHRLDKKQDKELQEKIEKFKQEIAEVGKKFGMTIVPVIEKYGPKLEVQILPPTSNIIKPPQVGGFEGKNND